MNVSRKAEQAMDVLSRIDATYGTAAMLLVSMQKPGCVIMHMLREIAAETTIVFLDTQYHFAETLLLRDQYIQMGVPIRTLYPALAAREQSAQANERPWLTSAGKDTCCRARKEEPLRRFVQEYGVRAKISGLMASEGGRRDRISLYGDDTRFGIPVVSPLFDWGKADVDEYLLRHRLPVHALYEQCYTSIGCAPCTTPILPGEDDRAGRWRHLNECAGGYCMLNYSDGGGI